MMTTDERIKAVSAVVALAALVWGVISFVQVQAIGAARPFLEKKLEWCETAVETTSRIATAPTMAASDIQRFWQMYWGVMGLIENRDITAAMIAFGNDLPVTAPPGSEGTEAPPEGLTSKSLALAHACRQELSREWSARWSRR